MKKIVFFLFIFVLIFLFFPFPKNTGQQDKTAERGQMAEQVSGYLPSVWTVLPKPETWPQPFALIYQTYHLPEKAKMTHNGPWTDLNSLPAYVPQAFIAIEDHRFYEHTGIDIDGILRATLANIQSDGIVQGGSTITQQLVKNQLLTDEQTASRKLSEIMLSFILENNYSKDEILELYLNTIYFGAGAYGIGEASSVYFAKTPGDLSLSEAATLAALPYAPSHLNPLKNPEECQVRRNLVLQSMIKYGMLTTAAAEGLYQQPIVTAEQ